MAGRPEERNAERTIALAVELWIEGRDTKEIFHKFGWKTNHAIYKYFKRHGYNFRELKKEAMEKRRMLGL